MWPIMFSSSFHPRMACIPDLPGKIVDWVPVDVAAATVQELLTRSISMPISSPEIYEEEREGKYEVCNIVNPTPIPWAQLVAMLQATYRNQNSDSVVGDKELEVVSMKTWVARLNKLSEQGMSVDEIPGLKLLGFFDEMAGDEEASKVFETAKTTAASLALRGCGEFCGEWIEGNMGVWRREGFVV